MPTSGCHADGCDAIPPWRVGRHSENSHPLTRCEGEQITPASRRDGWGEEKEGMDGGQSK